MDEDFIRRLRAAREQARSARQFSEQCKQRAARLMLQSSVLQQYFDELEQERRLRIDIAQSRKRAPV